jgi:hypothetical protein
MPQFANCEYAATRRARRNTAHGGASSAARRSQAPDVVWLEAILTVHDLQAILRQFCPAVFRLGDSGELELDEPTDVTLIDGRGMRVVCAAKLLWPVLGIHVPVSARSVAVMISPVVERAGEGNLEGEDAGETLVFKMHIEHIDVTLLPAFVDDRVTARVNEELEKKHVELAWKFPDTLSHVFQLPDALLSTSALGLEVVSGSVRVTDSALAFAISFRTQVHRRAPKPAR